ncbi:hypothetical protein AB6A40_009297 [Gnathostoma spinigerum]|uniref:ZP domain-containing protein n=1 Tax=Gnathostoma spinigerum TaxID=75299 RepID=A0ABD6EZL4_9BILA
MMSQIVVFFVLSFQTFIIAKTVDNKLLDTPRVTCGPERIEIRANTEDIYEGAVFVKNWRRTEGCSAIYTYENNSTEPEYSIALKDIARCGLEMRRNPDNQELEIFTVIIFSFHPNFVTASDRSFAVHCIFQQKQMKVATDLDFISDITTRGIISSIAEMPTIGMTIIPGRVPDHKLEPAHSVHVGDQLMFIWYIQSNSG